MRKILANLVLGSRNELHYTKKWSFPLRTSSVNATKSAVLKKSLMENFIFYAVWDKGSSLWCLLKSFGKTNISYLLIHTWTYWIYPVICTRKYCMYPLIYTRMYCMYPVICTRTYWMDDPDGLGSLQEAAFHSWLNGDGVFSSIKLHTVNLRHYPVKFSFFLEQFSYWTLGAEASCQKYVMEPFYKKIYHLLAIHYFYEKNGVINAS